MARIARKEKPARHAAAFHAESLFVAARSPSKRTAMPDAIVPRHTDTSAQTAALNAKKEKAALASIFASLAITLGKLVAGLMTGSLALLSEAGHALVDTGATIMTWFAVRAAGRPADDEHHYGHDKVEALAALAETGLLFALTAFVVFEATRRLIAHDHDVHASPIAFVVLGASILIDATRWVSLKRIAAETKSDALAADALHFSSDLFASILVLGALVAAHFGFPQADAYASFGVAAFVAIAGYRLGRHTVHTLLDAAPRGLAESWRAALDATPGVTQIDFLRMRPAGQKVFGEVSVGVARTASTERVARIAENARRSILAISPEADLTLTTRPHAVDDETALERTLLAAARLRLAVHHVTVQHIAGRLSVSLDLEVDGRMRLFEAHDVATILEAEIRNELGDDIEVETHIEPLEARELTGVDADAGTVAAITCSLVADAQSGGVLREVHNVRVRATDVGLIVNYHCRVDPDRSVEAVHEAVDAIDRRLRNTHETIIRVVGHAEPIRLPTH